ncbi:MAG: DUF92 domain-containing protein [Phaeodactylibacter sp.]|nr:DUF92 domain-containing protein [Phaeodactylibacter sp.]MCB9291878.1 DUF92 domain-containing protein [Lewinellaceae bacterium]
MSVYDPFFLIPAALALAAALAVALRLIDVPGAAVGWLVGCFIYLGGGLPLLMLLGVFFVTGSAATAWNLRKKAAMGLAQANRGRRSAINVLANGGVAAFLGVAAWLFPELPLPFPAMMAASLASAASDTLSSEMGNLYGSRYYHILGFGPGERGKDGVVSPEGTAFGVLGSLLVAGAFGLASGWGATALWVGLAGLFGNFTDSILGGSLQRQGYIDNHGVNFLSTLAAAGVMGGVAWAGG